MAQRTQRQQFWFDHVQAAQAFSGTMAEYARTHNLNAKYLYNWGAIFRREHDGTKRKQFVKVSAPVATLSQPSPRVRVSLGEAVLLIENCSPQWLAEFALACGKPS